MEEFRSIVGIGLYLYLEPLIIELSISGTISILSSFVAIDLSRFPTIRALPLASIVAKIYDLTSGQGM